MTLAAPQKPEIQDLNERIKEISERTGIRNLSLSETKLTDIEGLEESLVAIESGLTELPPEIKQELNDGGIQIVICDKSLAIISPFGNPIEIPTGVSKEDIQYIITQDLGTYRREKARSGFDISQSAVPQIGTSEDDFDFSSGDKTPIEGTDISGMGLGAAPRQFIEPEKPHRDLVSFSDGTQGVKRGPQGNLPELYKEPVAEPSPRRDSPIDFDALLSDVVPAKPAPVPAKAPVPEAPEPEPAPALALAPEPVTEPLPVQRKRSTTPASVRKHVKPTKGPLARFRMNLLPNQASKSKIKGILENIEEEVMTRVDRVMNSAKDRLDRYLRETEPEIIKPKTPKRIIKTTRADIARLFLGSMIVVIGGGAVVKAINKIPAVQSGHVWQLPTAQDVENYINPQSTEKSEEPSDQILTFSSIKEGEEKGYIVVLDDGIYHVKGYKWALSKEDRSKFEKTDPRRYAVIKK